MTTVYADVWNNPLPVLILLQAPDHSIRSLRGRPFKGAGMDLLKRITLPYCFLSRTGVDVSSGAGLRCV